MVQNKFIIAACFKFNGKFLFCKRSSHRTEYPGFWSLPTVKVSEQCHHSLHNERVEFLGEFLKKFGASPRTEPISIDDGQRYRQHYTLNMKLCEFHEAPELKNADKYTEFKWMDIDQAIQENSQLVGTCVSLLIQRQIMRGEFSQNPYFLEVPPELSSWKILNATSDDDLWVAAAANYSALKYGTSGGDGDIVRRLSIDPYLQSKLLASAGGKRMIDVGCGNGELVSSLSESGQDIVGYDLRPDELGKSEGDGRYFSGTVTELGNYFCEYTFDTIVMNLLLNWIENLDVLIQQLDFLAALKPDVHVTISAPEYSKNGEWSRSSKTPQWNISKPTRRAPFLTMVNRGVGPVRFHPYTLPDIINAFSKRNYYCLEAEYIFLDTDTPPDVLQFELESRPYLERHIFFPAFLYIRFGKLP